MEPMVRVKLANGAEATLGRAYAEAHKLDILEDKRATDARGYALNDKPHVKLSSASPYAGKSVEELQAEADARGVTAAGTGKDGKVVKNDLVAALTAADKA